MMTDLRLIALTVLCATVVSMGCAKKVPPATSAAAVPSVVDAAPSPPPPRAAASEPASSAVRLSDDELFARKTLDELNAERRSDVLFELDEWSSWRTRAQFCRRMPMAAALEITSITVEGHCDDRGTGEYNLALGERRANAVKEYLGSLGVTPDAFCGQQRRRIARLQRIRPECWNGIAAAIQ